jgi:hypothetical protein
MLIIKSTLLRTRKNFTYFAILAKISQKYINILDYRNKK